MNKPGDLNHVSVVCPCCDSVQCIPAYGFVGEYKCPRCALDFHEFIWTSASFDVRTNRSIIRACGDVAGPLRRLGLIR